MAGILRGGRNLKRIIRLTAFVMLAAYICGFAVFAEDFPGWTVDTNDATSQIKAVIDDAHDGRVALYVSTEQTSGNQSGNTKIYQKVYGLEPSTKYRITFWSKANNIEKFDLVRDVFYRSNAIADDSGSYDWTWQSIEFTSGKNASTTDIQFIVEYGNGEKAEVWIDDVSIYKLTESEPEGENLVENASFEDGVDLAPPADVTNAAVIGGDGFLTVTWNDSVSEKFTGVNIIVDGEQYGFAEAGRELFDIEGLANGRSYEIVLRAVDERGIVSDGVTLYGTPRAEAELPEVYADDENNVIIGIDEDMEYSVNGGEWISYTGRQPELSGSKLVKVRYKETSEQAAGKPVALLFFKNIKLYEDVLGISAQPQSDLIQISGTAPANSRVRVMAYAKDNPSEIVFISELDANDNGNFEKSFYIPYSANSGHYIAKAAEASCVKAVTVEFVYTDSATSEAFISELKEKTLTELAACLNLQENADILVSLGADLNAYYELSSDNAQMAAKIVYEQRNRISVSNFSNIMNTAIALAKLNQAKNGAEAAEVLTAFNKYLELSADGVPFERISDNGLTAWLGEKLYGNAFDGSEKLLARYRQLNAFYVFNNESYVNYTDVLEKYAQVLGIENNSVYASYGRLSNADKETVNRKVKLGNKTYDDTSLLMSDFKSAINSLSSTTGGSGGAGGSGGSGDGSSVSSIVTSVTGAVDIGIQPDADKASFGDLSDAAWAQEAISYLAENGVVSGMGDGSFMPNGLVTREQFAVMAVKAFGLEQTGEASEFSDVEQERWSREYIDTLKSNGLISGYDDGSFMPEKNITREEMFVILHRIVNYNGLDIPAVRDDAAFADWDSVSMYARDSVSAMYKSGLANGNENGMFDPAGMATRAMAAKVIYDILMNTI